MSQQSSNNQAFPPQQQNQQPGSQAQMNPQPVTIRDSYQGCGKLHNKVAVITGGDSGIGRAVAVTFAKEGADIAILYLSEEGDALATKKLVKAEGRRCLTLAGDVGSEPFCREAVNHVVQKLGKIDILVNNAGEQHPQDSVANISEEQLLRTFRTNIFSFFFMTKAALPFLQNGSCIINTTSVTAYEGSKQLIDYSTTKGAVVSFTRSLAQNVVSQGIRVNAVAPGPIWTPLIPASFTADQVATFGTDTPMKRAGQPAEVAPCYVFLASDDASYMTGQILHPNGGVMVSS